MRTTYSDEYPLTDEHPLDSANSEFCVQIVRSTIIEHDKDKDGYLNYEEFKALLSQPDLTSNVLP